MPTSPAPASPADRSLDRLLGALRDARHEMNAIVLGQPALVTHLLVGLIAGGHVLLEGPPGVGKTLTVKTLAEITGLTFARVQFTPDLMPADITGSTVLTPDAEGRNVLAFQPGPVFTQLLLADEINRATPRTQSALLEAMQEKTVSAAGASMALPRPFVVLATQNPIEMDGTYPLPEAQIDRFLFRLDVGYPDAETLVAILGATTGVRLRTATRLLEPDDILALQDLTRGVPVATHVARAVALFAVATQPGSAGADPEIGRFVRFGLSPRGAQALMLAAKGHALLNGRHHVAFDDLRAVLLPATRHRVQLNFQGRAEDVDVDALITRLFDTSVRAVA